MTGLPSGAAALSGLLLLAGGSGDFNRHYYQLHYDYETAAQCGLVSAAVERAFRAKRLSADASGALPADARKAIRLRAYVAAEQEYDNRGLGGHKPWCQGAVADGVRRLLKPPR